MSKKLHALLILTASLGMGTSIQADQTTYKNSESNNALSSTSTSEMTDKELAKKIHDKISSGTFMSGYDNVTIRTSNGNVTIGGYVNTEDDKAKVENEVRGITGVKKVTNQITVQKQQDNNQTKDFPKDTFRTSEDSLLNKKIRDSVSRGWLWNSYKDVKLNTNNGVVTLEGSVDDLKDQQKLVNEIQKIEGVKSVNSNLTIKNR